MPRKGPTVEQIKAALAANDSVHEAAAELGIHWVSLYRLLRRHGIEWRRETTIIVR